MNDVLNEVMEAAGWPDLQQARLWLLALCGSPDVGDEDWPTAQQGALDRLAANGIDASAASPVLQVLERAGGSTAIAALSDQGVDALCERYGAVLASWDSGGEATEADGYDEAAWQAYLAENGTAWDGQEESFQGFREWFSYYAAERGLAQPANQLMDYIAGQPDKRAALAAYGVTIAEPPQAPAAETPDASAGVAATSEPAARATATAEPSQRIDQEGDGTPADTDAPQAGEIWVDENEEHRLVLEQQDQGLALLRRLLTDEDALAQATRDGVIAAAE